MVGMGMESLSPGDTSELLTLQTFVTRLRIAACRRRRRRDEGMVVGLFTPRQPPTVQDAADGPARPNSPHSQFPLYDSSAPLHLRTFKAPL